AGPGPAPVRADPAQLEQAVVNLVVNARDAMPAGGTLTLELDAVELDAEAARRLPDGRPGSFVRLTVRDTGVGMTAEVRAHLSEPFFTPKGQGQGTGLGLSTVYGIVKQSGGFLDVWSEPGRGSAFTVYLPRAEGAVVAPAGAAAGRGARGSETILLVEDEA